MSELLHLQDKLMQEVDKIFGELIKKIGESHGSISGFCGSIYNTGHDGLCRSRCQEITKILLYMKGYDLTQTQGLQTRTVDQAHWTAFQEYLRCVLAGEALVRVYGSNRDHVDVMNRVSDYLTPGKTFMQQTLQSGICDNRDWGKVIFQSKSLGTALHNRLHDLNKTWPQVRAGAGHAARKCGWDDTDGTTHTDEPCNENDVVITEDDALMKTIRHSVEAADTFPNVRRVLHDMQKQGGYTGRCDIETKIKEKVQEMQNTVNRTKTTAARGQVPRGPGLGRGSGGGPGKAGSPSPRPGTGPGRRPRPRPRPVPPSTSSTKPSEPPTVATPAAGSEPPPQPVKPATAAQPVAVKPASPPSSGSGTTTTSSGGGGGGKGAAPGGNGNTEHTTCKGQRILDGTHTEVYVVHGYNADQWHQVKEVLEEFIKYLGTNNENFDALGANCYNTGWNDFDDVAYYTGQRVADMMRCRLMSGALWFANTDTKDDHINRLRCEVVHVFGHLLKTLYCKDKGGYKRGTEYAWETFKSMQSQGQNGTALVPGPVVEGKCTMCGYDQHRRWSKAINWEIADWLLGDGTISSEIAQMQQAMPCTTKWTDYIKDGEQQQESINKNLDDKGLKQVALVTKEIVEKATKVFEQVKKKVEQEIATVKDKDTTGGKKPADPPVKVPAVPQAVVPEKKVTSTKNGADAVGRSDNGAQRPVPQPPPAAPPPGQDGQGPKDEPKDKNTSAGKQDGPSCVTTINDKKVHRTPFHDNNVGIQLTLTDTSPTSGCAGSSTPGTPGTDSKTNIGTQPNVEDKKKDADANEHGSGKGTKGADSPPEPSRQADEQGKGDNLPTDGSCSGTSHPSGENSIVPRVIQKEDTSDGSEMFHPDWDGTQFPWEKKNETGSQAPAAAASPVSGTTGQQPSDSVDPNQRQCNPSENSAGTRPCVLEISPGHIPGIDTVSGGFAPPYPEHKASSPSNTNAGTGSGGPDGPDLTADVLTATTPVLFFLTSVTVALLGYSLWQYFAYLGQPRRRAYRTVRDVPSPPLDEEILQHLQRGELPPPVYGYTVMRAPRRDTFADRRGPRPPRVHKRTIIELHLEVLNECEAAEWENVKDDYLQILVEQFMGDDNGRCGAPVSSSNQESTTGHSTTADSTTLDSCRPNEEDPDPWSCMESKQLATDPCPPNEDDPDPCKCMETIQFATDPGPPNEEHSDPWSCMETMQLATDPCAPHDPDPWSCMETIQLQTHPCAPNEDHPDPWTCMENIQLATDTSPPNEHDPDPWSCMETRQLATDASPPNEEHPDPWSCMETIQLATDRCPTNDCASCSCMENIQLDAQQHAHSNPDHGHDTSYCTQWINWIDRNKHLLQQCTTQPWFLQLTADWTQYLRAHMAADAASGEHRTAATMDSKKHAWKQWIAQQHRQMSVYREQEWFHHLLVHIQEETAPEKRAVPIAQKALELDNVMGTEDVLRVRDVPRTQLHKQPYMKKRATANIWILLLALVIEQCEVECRLQETELYVDDLLAQL
ncbi:hypothetical protein AK88_04934 [Plasmodium fragile]|uniref:Schizont-infected cell agglutination C-terminal domain-containing protein n=1 Tax=Plasmodium fragile TaxID=5857 RepID=A0A0D9QI85_PLAFR|nr:uncharacterized protein AK88_04934 [Plasmodium fragile]KJP85431.1 hypothetical protein AK88_04934 [Plasmodium fragile]